MQLASRLTAPRGHILHKKISGPKETQQRSGSLARNCVASPSNRTPPLAPPQVRFLAEVRLRSHPAIRRAHFADSPITTQDLWVMLDFLCLIERRKANTGHLRFASTTHWMIIDTSFAMHAIRFESQWNLALLFVSVRIPFGSARLSLNRTGGIAPTLGRNWNGFGSRRHRK